MLNALRGELSVLQYVSDFVHAQVLPASMPGTFMKIGCMQESEGEDAAEGRVTLAQDMGRGNLASRQSRIRLQEVRFFRHKLCRYT